MEIFQFELHCEDVFQGFIAEPDWTTTACPPQRYQLRWSWIFCHFYLAVTMDCDVDFAKQKWSTCYTSYSEITKIDYFSPS